MAKLYFLPGRLQEHGRLLRVGWRLEDYCVGAFFALLRWLPLPRATALAQSLFRWLGPRTSIVNRLLPNLAIIHPHAPMATLQGHAREHFGWLGVALAELTHIGEISARMHELVEFELEPSAAAVLADPAQAAVLVTAHVGPWTLTSLIASHLGFPLTIIYAPESNPYLRARLLALRGQLPVQLVERDGSMRRLMRELAAGHKVGLASDVRLDGGDCVPLFGHPMEINMMAARLALRHNCPLIPVTAYRLARGRIRIVVEAAIDAGPPDTPAPLRMTALTHELAAIYERWVRERPDQWMCMARRWPKPLGRDAMARARACPEHPE